MKQQIRTKWHKLLPLIEKDEVYFTAPKGGVARHWSSYNCKKQILVEAIQTWGMLPHFVVDRELIDLVSNSEFRRSLLDMKKANVLRLPFPAITVEYPAINSIEVNGRATTRTNIVILRDLYHREKLNWETDEVFSSYTPEKRSDFYGVCFGVNEDDKGTYLHVSPSIIYLGIEEKNEINSKEIFTGITLDESSDQVWCHIVAHGNGIVNWDKETEDLVNKTYTKDVGVVFFAACAAYLLMATAGIEKTVVETTKINKGRGGPNKPYIPAHTYIHIGRVYRSANSDVSDEYHPRRSPRPHWRRGHLKHVRYGQGRNQLREVFIKPKLVAYRGDAEPITPDYIVSN